MARLHQLLKVLVYVMLHILAVLVSVHVDKVFSEAKRVAGWIWRIDCQW